MYTSTTTASAWSTRARYRTPASARRCVAVAVACVLVLAASLACVSASDIASCRVLRNQTYDDDTLKLSATALSARGQRTCVIIDATVRGAGLTITSDGMSTDILRMHVIYTNITDASVAIEGSIPTNAQLFFINTQASMQSRKSVFDTTSMHLQAGAIVTIANTTATWPDATNAGSVVQMSTRMLTSPQSGIFVTGVTATRAASVVASAGFGAYIFAADAVVAVDYCTCIDCNGALVNFGNIALGGQSMLRISNSTADVLLHTGPATLYGDSRLLLSSNIAHDHLFDIAYLGGYEGGDVIELWNITAPRKPQLPNTVPGTTILVGEWNVPDFTPEDEDSYISGASATVQILDANKRLFDGTCSTAQCIAIDSEAPVDDECNCPCAQGTYGPSCTRVVNPTKKINDIITNISRSSNYSNITGTPAPVPTPSSSTYSNSNITGTPAPVPTASSSTYSNSNITGTPAPVPTASSSNYSNSNITPAPVPTPSSSNYSNSNITGTPAPTPSSNN